MPNKNVTVRFYLAGKAPSTAPYAWPPSPPLRAIVGAALPKVGDDGLIVAHAGQTYLVEQAAGTPGTTHVMVSVDMEEVPAVRDHERTSPMTLQGTQVPALTTHIALLPAGVVAVVRAGVESPHPRTCAAVVTDATGVPIELTPLVRDDQLKVLNGSTGVTKATLKFVDIDPKLTEQDSVLDAASKLLGAGMFEATIVLNARKTADKIRLRSRLLELMAWRAAGRVRLKTASATLPSIGAGIPGKFINLIEDEITERMVVPLQLVGPSSTLLPSQVADSIKQAYNSLLDIIGAALAETPSEFADDK